jgi:hypothetical protein
VYKFLQSRDWFCPMTLPAIIEIITSVIKILVGLALSSVFNVLKTVIKFYNVYGVWHVCNFSSRFTFNKIND